MVLMFASTLPHGHFLPILAKHGASLVAEVLIGSNGATGLIYALRVILCGVGRCDEIDGDAAELIFVVVAYDGEDADMDEQVFYSGNETLLHIPDSNVRSKVAGLVSTLGEYLVSEMMPNRLIFVTKYSNIPLRALPKYENLSEKILALGYSCSKYPTEDGRQLWDLQQIRPTKERMK